MTLGNAYEYDDEHDDADHWPRFQGHDIFNV